MLILMIEGFGIFLKAMFCNDDLVVIQQDNNNPLVYHLQFFNYAMFMGVPTIKEAYAIENLLKFFFDSSTSLVIMIKYKILFFHVHFSVQNNLSRILVFGWCSFPTK